MHKILVVIIICTVVNVALFVLSRLRAKRTKSSSDERGADSLTRRAERGIDAAEQHAEQLATEIDDCRRQSESASELTARAKDLNARAREICKNSRKILKETQDLLKDCTSRTSNR